MLESTVTPIPKTGLASSPLRSILCIEITGGTFNDGNTAREGARLACRNIIPQIVVQLIEMHFSNVEETLQGMKLQSCTV